MWLLLPRACSHLCVPVCVPSCVDTCVQGTPWRWDGREWWYGAAPRVVGHAEHDQRPRGLPGIRHGRRQTRCVWATHIVLRLYTEKGGIGGLEKGGLLGLIPWSAANQVRVGHTCHRTHSTAAVYIKPIVSLPYMLYIEEGGVGLIPCGRRHSRCGAMQYVHVLRSEALIGCIPSSWIPQHAVGKTLLGTRHAARRVQLVCSILSVPFLRTRDTRNCYTLVCSTS